MEWVGGNDGERWQEEYRKFRNYLKYSIINISFIALTFSKGSEQHN